MSIKKTTYRHVSVSALCAALGICSLLLGGVFIAKHIDAVSQAQEVSVPLVASLPTLERRLDTVKEQVEIAELHSAMQLGSHEERIRMYVVPEKIDLDRLIAIFEILGEHMKSEGVIQSMSPIEIGQEEVSAEYASVPVRVSFVANKEGVRQLFTLLKLAGILTISDALSDDERTLLFDRTESENPAGITALETFLSTDLLQYSLEPQPHDSAIRRSFATKNFESLLQNILQTSRLRDARRLLGSSFGKVLYEYELWPLPLMTFDSIKTEGGSLEGTNTLHIQLRVYRRL